MAGKHNGWSALRLRGRGAVAGVVLLWAVSTPCWSLPQEAPGTAAEWQARLRAIGERLLAEDWTWAERETTRLVGEMTEQIVGGAGTDLLLGVATTYRALALAGQDRGAEAVWHWQVAQQLFPRVADLDLARFGMQAEALAMHPPRQDAPRDRPSGPPRDGEFVPPRRIEAPPPEFPAGRAFQGLEVDVVVQVIVDVDGRPREPLIVDSRGELTLVWAALEALRQWRFEPATRYGVAEPSLYKLTVSFVVPTS